MQVGREIAKPGGVLKVKMFARVALLRGGSTTAVRMPNTSLVLRGTENFVIVEREPGVLATRKVRVSINGLIRATQVVVRIRCGILVCSWARPAKSAPQRLLAFIYKIINE